MKPNRDSPSKQGHAPPIKRQQRWMDAETMGHLCHQSDGILYSSQKIRLSLTKSAIIAKQNLHCGCPSKSPWRSGSNENHQPMFCTNTRKIMYTLEDPTWHYAKRGPQGLMLHGHVKMIYKLSINWIEIVMSGLFSTNVHIRRLNSIHPKGIYTNSITGQKHTCRPRTPVTATS